MNRHVPPKRFLLGKTLCEVGGLSFQMKLSWPLSVARFELREFFSSSFIEAQEKKHHFVVCGKLSRFDCGCGSREKQNPTMSSKQTIHSHVIKVPNCQFRRLINQNSKLCTFVLQRLATLFYLGPSGGELGKKRGRRKSQEKSSSSAKSSFFGFPSFGEGKLAAKIRKFLANLHFSSTQAESFSQKV